MPNYLEIVRLNELSFSQRKISDMVGPSLNVPSIPRVSTNWTYVKISDTVN